MAKLTYFTVKTAEGTFGLVNGTRELLDLTGTGLVTGDLSQLQGDIAACAVPVVVIDSIGMLAKLRSELQRVARNRQSN
jgi:hypothetical protein